MLDRRSFYKLMALWLKFAAADSLIDSVNVIVSIWTARRA